MENKEKNILYLRHKTRDIAIYELEIFIKDCVILGIKEVKIIHGKQGGVLRNAVHEYLKENKNIESYKLGGYYEGQSGVTIAKIK